MKEVLKMSKVKISGFYDEYSRDLRKQLELAKSLGEEYICLRNIGLKKISKYSVEEFESELLPMFLEYGIKASSLGSPIGKIKLDDEEGYARQVKELKELVKICDLLNCKYIRTFSFFVDSKGNYDEYFPKVVKKIEGFLKVVEGTDIILLHENEKEIYGDIPKRVIQLYKEINHAQYKLAYDASNYIQCDSDPLKAYEDTKEYTSYYHVKDCSPEKVEVPLGLGEGNYQYIIKDLIQNRNYNGFFTMEPHTGKYARLKKSVYLFGFITNRIKR